MEKKGKNREMTKEIKRRKKYIKEKNGRLKVERKSS